MIHVNFVREKIFMRNKPDPPAFTNLATIVAGRGQWGVAPILGQEISTSE
jgi:hypothetical protein